MRSIGAIVTTLTFPRALTSALLSASARHASIAVEHFAIVAFQDVRRVVFAVDVSSRAFARLVDASLLGLAEMLVLFFGTVFGAFGALGLVARILAFRLLRLGNVGTFASQDAGAGMRSKVAIQADASRHALLP